MRGSPAAVKDGNKKKEVCKKPENVIGATPRPNCYFPLCETSVKRPLPGATPRGLFLVEDPSVSGPGYSVGMRAAGEVLYLEPEPEGPAEIGVSPERVSGHPIRADNLEDVSPSQLVSESRFSFGSWASRRRGKRGSKPD